MTTIRVDESFFRGAVSFSRTGSGVAPIRLPISLAPLFPSTGGMLLERAHSPSGCRLRFATSSRALVLEIEPRDTGAERHVIDLTREGEFIESLEVESGAGRVGFRLPSGGHEQTWEVWLHQFHPTRIAAIQVDDGSSFSIPPDPRPRWITYGSSITMCRSAASPARTWPAVAARRLGLDLTSLGFGGQCQLDPMVARVIRDLPAELITLKLGINVYGAAALSPRTYPGAVIGLVRTIRDSHPFTPIGVITSIHSPGRETEPNAVGATLEAYREMTRDAVARLRQAGDERIEIFEGTMLLGEAEAGLLPDGLHPGPQGYELMGERAAELVLTPLIERYGVAARADRPPAS